MINITVIQRIDNHKNILLLHWLKCKRINFALVVKMENCFKRWIRNLFVPELRYC